MNELFLKVLNASISASWLVMAVLLLRLMLRKAPKWSRGLLWGIVGFRLLFPGSIESPLSLIPSARTIPMDIAMNAAPVIDSGITALNRVVNPVITASFSPNPGDSANPLQIWIALGAAVWILGAVVLFGYTAFSWRRLHRSVRTAVRYRDNIFQSEEVTTPFVLGIFRPRIYLPFKLDDRSLEYVVAHERAHICRGDHWWKPLGFLLLTVHWFNPLMWLAFILLCRDLELACDERVIKNLGSEQRADYTQALVACSVNRTMIGACPIAFGEIGVKDRVKSVLRYKKPGILMVAAAAVICAAAAVCFVTDPAGEKLCTGNAGVQDGITSIEIHTAGESAVLSDPESMEQILEWLGGVRVSRSTLTRNRSQDRDKTNAIVLRYQNLLSTAYCFSRDFSEVWVDDSVKPSLSRSVLNTRDVKAFFEREDGWSARQRLSLNDCIILSGKGYDLTWADFEQFRYQETGSGLYIRVYEINDGYELRIGGGSMESEPMYVYLVHKEEPDTRIDIRDGGVTEFISQNRRPKFYLTIGEEGVKRIEVSLPYSSGGCENADGSLFRKGDRVWLEQLDGCSDLRGLTIRALGKDGEIIWSASVSDEDSNEGFTRLTQDGWTITDIE